MRNFKLLCVTASILLAFSLSAQENLSAHAKAGLFLPFNDFSESSFQGSKPNFFTTVGLGYELPHNFFLKGDLTAGGLNGRNGDLYYQTSVIEGFLYGQYDLLSLLTESKFKIKAEAGLGLLLYNAKLYNFNTRSLIAESPSPADKGLSINPVIGAGGQLGYSITDNIEANVGVGLKLVIGNDFMDGFDGGDASDYYGNFHVGLTYNFGKKADPGIIELDRKRYNGLISTIDSLENEANKAGPEKIAKLEMESQEKDLRIKMLESELDSARAKVVSIPTESTEPAAAKPDAESILANPQYRIIVASLPSRAMAQRWIDRMTIDNSEAIIVYVDDLNTYRVIYKSYDTYAAAKKGLQQVKSAVPDAWIKKF